MACIRRYNEVLGEVVLALLFVKIISIVVANFDVVVVGALVVGVVRGYVDIFVVIVVFARYY